MPSLPRATCPICDRVVAQRRNGELREHQNRPTPFQSHKCAGSGWSVLENIRHLAEGRLHKLQEAPRVSW